MRALQTQADLASEANLSQEAVTGRAAFAIAASTLNSTSSAPHREANEVEPIEDNISHQSRKTWTVCLVSG